MQLRPFASQVEEAVAGTQFFQRAMCAEMEDVESTDMAIIQDTLR